MEDEDLKRYYRLGRIIFGLYLLAQLRPFLVAVLALIGAGCVYEQMKKR